jgi:hypothetical protein
MYITYFLAPLQVGSKAEEKLTQISLKLTVYGNGRVPSLQFRAPLQPAAAAASVASMAASVASMAATVANCQVQRAMVMEATAPTWDLDLKSIRLERLSTVDLLGLCSQPLFPFLPVPCPL